MSRPQPVRVTLLCHAATAAMRAGRFPSPDDPLDVTALRRLKRLSVRPNPRHRCWTSPARRAVETAAALGLAATPDPLLDDADSGRWAGLPLAELQSTEPDHVAAWLDNPAAAPHGGETSEAVVARVARWLDQQGEGPAIVAVTHAAVIRAAVVLAIGASAASIPHIDVSPLGLTRLSGSPGRWRLVGHNLGVDDF